MGMSVACHHGHRFVRETNGAFQCNRCGMVAFGTFEDPDVKRYKDWLVSILNFTGAGHIGRMCEAALFEGKTVEQFYRPEG
jgi:hypothetical protein